jgi:hypothetical protein
MKSIMRCRQNGKNEISNNRVENRTIPLYSVDQLNQAQWTQKSEPFHTLSYHNMHLLWVNDHSKMLQTPLQPWKTKNS